MQLALTSNDGMELYINAYSVPTICNPLSNQAVQVAVQEYPHLQDLELADNLEARTEVEIDVLIGADYYWNFFTGEIRKGRSPGPVALNTKLGWVLSGPLAFKCKGNPECAVNICSTYALRIDTSTINIEQQPDRINEQLSRFWDLESLGIQKNEMSVEEKFIQELKFDGQRYETKLPFKDNHPMLPDNHSICVKRLGSLLSRL